MENNEMSMREALKILGLGYDYSLFDLRDSLLNKNVKMFEITLSNSRSMVPIYDIQAELSKITNACNVLLGSTENTQKSDVIEFFNHRLKIIEKIFANQEIISTMISAIKEKYEEYLTDYEKDCQKLKKILSFDHDLLSKCLKTYVTTNPELIKAIIDAIDNVMHENLKLEAENEYEEYMAKHYAKKDDDYIPCNLLNLLSK